MSGCSSQVHERAIGAEVKSSHDLRGTHQAVAVHPHEELALGAFAPKVVGKQRTISAERLFPSIRSFADGVFEIRPELPQALVRVMNVARHAIRTRLAKVCRCGRRILIPSFRLYK